MAHEFFLPDIGEGLTEAVVVGWYVAVGDAVSLDEPLVEIETDKAVTDIPSPVGGVLLHRGAEPGDTLAVGGLLAVVGAAGEAWEPSPEGSAVEPAAPIVGSLETVPASPAAAAPAQALPLVRKLAGELGVDLATVSGSGPGGRITDDDVRAAAAAHGPEERVRMSPLRRTIADNLARSWQQIPHVTTFDEADAAPLLALRERRGKPPLEALLIEMVLPLLVRFPAFNAAVAGDEIVYRKHYDVGFAVDTPEGLMVAVVHDAPAYEGEALADEVRRLADAARARTAAPQELRGQTFTISNIGAVGGRYGTPIVPLGTSAILSVGRADERPVVREGRVVVGREFPLSLSYDHRVIDGAAGRAFMGALVDAVETA
jgi:pyruvate dehydrogenase E2 component (dihydrolipoamide acetyltransferase)